MLFDVKKEDPVVTLGRALVYEVTANDYIMLAVTTAFHILHIGYCNNPLLSSCPCFLVRYVWKASACFCYEPCILQYMTNTVLLKSFWTTICRKILWVDKIAPEVLLYQDGVEISAHDTQMVK